jgi:transcriptional regulator with XRE-family HTH domain
MAEKSEQIEEIEENLVKKTCRELGITQKELAEKIGVSPEAISRWNRGTNQIPKTVELLFLTILENLNYKKIDRELLKFRNTIDKLILNQV